MKLLLHACCGPCSLEPVRLLRAAGHDLTIAYTNSNIAPADEYAHRLATLHTWAASEQVPVVEGFYDPAAWEACAGRIGEAAHDPAVDRRRERQAVGARGRGAEEQQRGQEHRQDGSHAGVVSTAEPDFPRGGGSVDKSAALCAAAARG